MTSPLSGDPAATPGRLSRRRALSGVGGVGLTLPFLSACAEDDTAAVPTGSAQDADPPGSTSDETPSGTPDSAGLTATADIPVGGGVIFSDSRVVVTQPEAGDFKCFSAVCTHTGCIVTSVTSTILCQCHASSFDLSTGAVLGGPAGAPLPAVDFTIDKDQVVLT